MRQSKRIQTTIFSKISIDSDYSFFPGIWGKVVIMYMKMEYFISHVHINYYAINTKCMHSLMSCSSLHYLLHLPFIIGTFSILMCYPPNTVCSHWGNIIFDAKHCSMHKQILLFVGIFRQAQTNPSHCEQHWLEVVITLYLRIPLMLHQLHLLKSCYIQVYFSLGIILLLM